MFVVYCVLFSVVAQIAQASPVKFPSINDVEVEKLRQECQLLCVSIKRGVFCVVSMYGILKELDKTPWENMDM